MSINQVLALLIFLTLSRLEGVKDSYRKNTYNEICTHLSILVIKRFSHTSVIDYGPYNTNNIDYDQTF